MSNIFQAVDDFNRKYYPSEFYSFDCTKPGIYATLSSFALDFHDIAQRLADFASEYKEQGKNELAARYTRLHLITEELAEVTDAMATSDELGLLDGLADLLYVVIGTGSVFQLPLEAASFEVHDANMTKDIGDDARHAHPRKGQHYRPPNLAYILSKHRVHIRISSACGMVTRNLIDQCPHCNSALSDITELELLVSEARVRETIPDYRIEWDACQTFSFQAACNPSLWKAYKNPWTQDQIVAQFSEVFWQVINAMELR